MNPLVVKEGYSAQSYIQAFKDAVWFLISETPANKILAFTNIYSVNIKYWQQFRQNYYNKNVYILKIKII